MNTSKSAILKNYTKIYAKISRFNLTKKISETSPSGAGVGSRAPVQRSRLWASPGSRISGRWQDIERETESGQIKLEKG